MKSILRLLTLATLLPVLSTPGMAQRTQAPVDELEADTGAQNCVRLRRINRTEIIDNRTIAFHMRGGDIYLNRLDRACRGLDRGDPISYRTATGRLCSVDMITIVDRFDLGLMGPTCGLGMFTPTSQEAIDILKGEDEPADVEVTVVPIEIEQPEEAE
jgi:hypothetical protein